MRANKVIIVTVLLNPGSIILDMNISKIELVQESTSRVTDWRN